MLKVAKKRSDIVKRLMKMGPCYMSENTVHGKEDCAKLFPEDYNVEEEQAEESCDNENKKKKKKRRKKRDKIEADGDQSQSATADQMSAQDSEDTLDGETWFWEALKSFISLFPVLDLSADEDAIQLDGKEADGNDAPPSSPNPWKLFWEMD